MGSGEQLHPLVQGTSEVLASLPRPAQDTVEVGRPSGLRRIVAYSAAAVVGVVGVAVPTHDNGSEVEAASYGVGDIPDQFQVETGHLSAGEVLKVTIDQAVGGKTVVGNLTSDRSDADGFVTAFACGDPIPLASDLNPRHGEVVTNRLIAQANDLGEICFYTLQGTDLIVDVNGLAEVENFANRRTDTRLTQHLQPEQVLRVNVPEAVGGKTVVGNLTADNVDADGFITAFSCDEGRPLASDLNPTRGRVVSNRFIGEASLSGDICFYTLKGTDLIIDVNGIWNGSSPMPNQRTDTRDGTHLNAGSVLRVNIPEASGGVTVVGNVTSVNSGEAGYVTVYACDRGMPLQSDLNPQFGRVTSNRLIAAPDANGNLCFYTLNDTDLVVDINGLVEGATSFANVRFDTREPTIPTQSSCNNAGWIERHANGSTDVAVYMGATDRVLRYGIAPEDVPYNFEMDPSTCNAPAIVYSVLNPATGRYSIYRKDLATGVERQIPTGLNPAFENAREPDPLFDQVFFTQYIQYQRNLMSTRGNSLGAAIAEFSVNDTGTTLAAIQTYRQPLRPAPEADYVNVMAQWTDPVTRRQVLIGHEFTRDTGENVSNIETATDGEDVLILRSLNHSPLTSLYKVTPHPTAVSPYTGVPEVVFEPITIPTIDPGEIQAYKVLADDSIIAVLNEDGVKSTVKIDLVMGTITELTPGYDVSLVDISM